MFSNSMAEAGTVIEMSFCFSIRERGEFISMDTVGPIQRRILTFHQQSVFLMKHRFTKSCYRYDIDDESSSILEQRRGTIKCPSRYTCTAVPCLGTTALLNKHPLFLVELYSKNEQSAGTRSVERA